MKIRNVNITDLPELVVIENLCFTSEEAAAKEAFEQRIRLIPDSFFVALEDGVLKGLVNGPVIETPFITDDLFSEIKVNPATGGHQSILGLAVLPKYAKQGIATALLAHFEREARLKSRETMTLTCKEKLIPFYQKHGFRNAGKSTSEHGGVTWYNMTKKLS